MKTVVYIDALFLINFLINMILLKITEMFIKRKSKLTNICASSVIGAFYAVCMFFPQVNFLYIFPVKLLLSALMIKIVYPRCTTFGLVRICAVFFLVSFTFAGVILALVYFTGLNDRSDIVVNNGIFYFDVSLWTLISSSAIAYIIIKIASAVFSRNKMMGIRMLKITLSGRECSMPALSDTGNLLTDPISNYPVVVADKSLLKELFPNGIPDFEKITETNTKIRVIPYSSVGNESSVMYGFVPDKITIDGQTAFNAVVGISEKALSSTNEYNALFNPNILNQNRRL